MLKKKSYQTRLYGNVAIIIFIIMLISGSIFYYYSALVLREQLERNTDESLKVVQSRVEDQYHTMEEITKRLHASNVLLELAGQIKQRPGNHFVQNTKDKSKINHLFLESIISEDLSSSLHYMSIYGDYYSTFLNIYPYSEHVFSSEELEDYYMQANRLLGDSYQAVWAPHYDKWTDSEHEVFSVLRVIRNNFKQFGILEMSLDVEVLDQLCELNELSDEYAVFIQTGGKTVYRNGQRNRAQYTQESAYYNEDMEYYFSDKNTLWVKSTSETLGWTFVMRRSVQEFNESLDNLRRVILFSYSTGFGIILIFLYALTHSLIKPLRSLRDRLLLLSQEGKNSDDMLIPSEDEIATLTVSIENLVEEIRLKDHILEEARRQTIQAHLNNLEAQINPHFLYNTLAVIGATGLEGGKEDIYVMCETLSDLLRYSIKYENRPVLFASELDNVRQYLFLMKKRYEEGIQISWNLSRELDEILIPKLIFQPIAENAFRHGFEGQKPPWRMEIETKLDADRWYFTIKNNGKGFDEERLRSIEQKMQEFKESTLASLEKEETQGYGLENTLKRLYFYYGNKYYFEVVNGKDEVSITIGGSIGELQV
ncbi:MAG: histidine kinase [Lachnospiraceae bacterium]